MENTTEKLENTAAADDGKTCVIEIPETENVTENECYEILNTIRIYDTLKKKPEARYAENKKTNLGILIFGVLFVIAAAIMYGFHFYPVVASVLVTIGALFVFTGTYSALIIKRQKKAMMSNAVKQTFTLDEDGVELKEEGGNSFRTAWNKIAFVKEFDYIVAFIPKERGGLIITVSKKYALSIRSYLNRFHPEIQAYNNGNSDRY